MARVPVLTRTYTETGKSELVAVHAGPNGTFAVVSFDKGSDVYTKCEQELKTMMAEDGVDCSKAECKHGLSAQADRINFTAWMQEYGTAIMAGLVATAIGGDLAAMRRGTNVLRHCI